MMGTHSFVREEEGPAVTLPLKGRASWPQLSGDRELAGYPRVQLLQDAFIAELDEAALVEHHPTGRIVRVDGPRGGGRAGGDEVVGGVIHGALRARSWRAVRSLKQGHAARSRKRWYVKEKKRRRGRREREEEGLLY